MLAICPATMTFSEEILNGIMDVAAAHKNGQGADLVGINMEGPYISPKKIGAQNPKYVQGAHAAMFRRLQARSGGLIKLVDVAPEEPGNLDFIRDCHNEVCISIAHTCTDYDTAKAAFAAGASHMTHLYNAMPGITVEMNIHQTGQSIGTVGIQNFLALQRGRTKGNAAIPDGQIPCFEGMFRRISSCIFDNH